MIVAEVIDILGKVTKEEDVLVANFPCDFDLRQVSNDSTNTTAKHTHVSPITGTDN